MRWGIYAHVPWCRTRCPYCAFTIVPRQEPEEERWLDGVLAEWRRWRSAFPDAEPLTLYLGGGTPSRLSPTTIGRLREACRPRHTTVEANPEDMTESWLRGVIDAGVDRISLGVQSTVPRIARALGRGHSAIAPAVERLRRAPLRSWSVDLIFGLAGQTIDELDRDLDRIIAWEAPHVSIYGLTVEPGTGFAALERRGRDVVVDPDRWRTLYDHLVDRLERAGLLRYEISNFARDGHRALHNALYWSDRPYMGLGPGAHGYAADGRRWVNPPWERWVTGEPPAIERPDPRRAAIDRLISGLRATEGIALDTLRGFQLDPRTVRQLESAGLLRVEPDRIALRNRGFPVADGVIRALCATLRSR